METPSKDLAKHVSVSIDENGKSPSVGYVQDIMRLLKFENKMEDCHMWFEDHGGRIVVNVLENVALRIKKTEMLTLRKLNEMKDGQVIAKGVITEPRICKFEIKWIALRGNGYPDWTIYFHHSNMRDEYIKRVGDKMVSFDVIRELVPCDEEAFKMYRL